MNKNDFEFVEDLIEDRNFENVESFDPFSEFYEFLDINSPCKNCSNYGKNFCLCTLGNTVIY